jgi:hypothetical protein
MTRSGNAQRLNELHSHFEQRSRSRERNGRLRNAGTKAQASASRDGLTPVWWSECPMSPDGESWGSDTRARSDLPRCSAMHSGLGRQPTRRHAVVVGDNLDDDEFRSPMSPQCNCAPGKGRRAQTRRDAAGLVTAAINHNCLAAAGSCDRCGQWACSSGLCTYSLCALWRRSF